MWLPLPVETSSGVAKPPRAPMTASARAFCSTASAAAKAATTTIIANTGPTANTP